MVLFVLRKAGPPILAGLGCWLASIRQVWYPPPEAVRHPIMWQYQGVLTAAAGLVLVLAAGAGFCWLERRQNNSLVGWGSFAYSLLVGMMLGGGVVWCFLLLVGRWLLQGIPRA